MHLQCAVGNQRNAVSLVLCIYEESLKSSHSGSSEQLQSVASCGHRVTASLFARGLFVITNPGASVCGPLRSVTCGRWPAGSSVASGRSLQVTLNAWDSPPVTLRLKISDSWAVTDTQEPPVCSCVRLPGLTLLTNVYMWTNPMRVDTHLLYMSIYVFVSFMLTGNIQWNKRDKTSSFGLKRYRLN